MRTGLSQSLSIWNYADPYDDSFSVVDGEWLKSNSEEVLNRTLAVQSGGSNGQPQLKAQLFFPVEKDLPMPTYSMPGLDIV